MADKFGAGRGSDTEGLGARNTQPTSGAGGRSRRPSPVAPDGPAFADYEDADGPGYFAENANCTWCGGEGSFWGQELPGYDPGWHDPDSLYPCPACHGTGNREDQVLF